MHIEYSKIVIGYGGRMLKRPYRVVEYYYPIEELREELYKRTSIFGKYQADKDGKSEFERITLSADEGAMADVLMRQAADDVAMVCEPFTIAGEMSYEYDEKAVESGAVRRWGLCRGADGTVYRAVVDGVVEDAPGDCFEEVPETMVGSIHFVMKKGLETYGNTVELTDKALWEMMTMYVMWQWMLIASPERAAQYETMYQAARKIAIYKLNMCNKKSAAVHPF